MVAPNTQEKDNFNAQAQALFSAICAFEYKKERNQQLYAALQNHINILFPEEENRDSIDFTQEKNLNALMALLSYVEIALTEAKGIRSSFRSNLSTTISTALEEKESKASQDDIDTVIAKIRGLPAKFLQHKRIPTAKAKDEIKADMRQITKLLQAIVAKFKQGKAKVERIFRQYRDTYNWVGSNERFIISKTPENAGDVSRYMHECVKQQKPLGLIISVVEPEELLFQENRVGHIIVSAKDHSAELDTAALKTALLAMLDVEAKGQTTLIHCNLGQGRSPQLLATYLVLKKLASDSKKPCDVNLDDYIIAAYKEIKGSRRYCTFDENKSNEAGSSSYNRTQAIIEAIQGNGEYGNTDTNLYAAFQEKYNQAKETNDNKLDQRIEKKQLNIPSTVGMWKPVQAPQAALSEQAKRHIRAAATRR